MRNFKGSRRYLNIAGRLVALKEIAVFFGIISIAGACRMGFNILARFPRRENYCRRCPQQVRRRLCSTTTMPPQPAAEDRNADGKTHNPAADKGTDSIQTSTGAETECRRGEARALAKKLGLKLIEKNSIRMDLVLIPPGKITLGSSASKRIAIKTKLRSRSR